MEKKSKALIMVFVLALFIALGYSYYRYVSVGDFLIDESQVEEEVMDETVEEGLVDDDGNVSESETEAGA